MYGSYYMIRMVGSFSSIDDSRSEKMIKIYEQFKYMNVLESTYTGNVMCLTSYTSNTLEVTLGGLVLLKKLV